jgi:murein DD-endopeptidase MepM/ murein hydrolase activator NlpD
VNSIRDDLRDLGRVFIWYAQRKLKISGLVFERLKNWWVEKLMSRRGALQKKVWHGSIIGLASVGVLTSGVFGGQTLVSATYPGVVASDPRFVDSLEPLPEGILAGSDTITNVSQKPRAEIIDYQVADGDTLSIIANKFAISTETIKWANNLDNIHTIKPGQTLKILPVSGVAVTVKSGDTLESLAKKYSASSQAILDFPFNDIPDDFSLKSGQSLIIPEGSPPESAAPKTRAQPQYIAQNLPNSPTFNAPSGGSFIWPTVMKTYGNLFAWWHPGVDFANSSAPPVVASDGGTVVVAGWPDGYGYGNRVVINHGNGYQTLYAHLSNIYVSVGQTVSRGQTIGQMGNTGRSTGTHLHFEVHYKGVAVNPLGILK